MANSQHNKRVVVSLLVVVPLSLAACGGSPTAPAPPPPPPPPVVAACQAQNFAVLVFANQHTRLTYDIVVDNTITGAIGPGVVTPPYPVAAGVQHRVEFRYTNTNLVACIATPVPVVCTTTGLSCAL